MLSFDRGEPIAHIVDKNGKKIMKVFVTEERDQPDIECDNLTELITQSDIDAVAKKLKLSGIEKRILTKKIALSLDPLKKSHDRSISLESERINLAIMELQDVSKMKLKKHIKLENNTIIPLIGGNSKAYDRSIFLCGPSGSGKTFLSEQIMLNDEMTRPVVVFSKIENDDSLNKLNKQLLKKSVKKLDMEGESHKPRMIKINLRSESDLMNLPSNTELKNCICFFDDIDSFRKDMADFINAYRDSLLESGRHNNISVISTSHMLYNWAKTRVILNEAQLVCMFPHSNKRNSMKFLKERMGLSHDETMPIIQEAMTSGRFLACRVSAPNIVIHAKGILIL